eukprot:4524701-Amphidinium_carterae.1
MTQGTFVWHRGRLKRGNVVAVKMYRTGGKTKKVSAKDAGCEDLHFPLLVGERDALLQLACSHANVQRIHGICLPAQLAPCKEEVTTHCNATRTMHPSTILLLQSKRKLLAMLADCFFECVV